MLQPMAVTAIRGLLMEMVAALFLMPCLYLYSHNKRRKPMNLKPVHIGLEIEDVQKVIAISLRVGPLTDIGFFIK